MTLGARLHFQFVCRDSRKSRIIIKIDFSGGGNCSRQNFRGFPPWHDKNIGETMELNESLQNYFHRSFKDCHPVKNPATLSSPFFLKVTPLSMVDAPPGRWVIHWVGSHGGSRPGPFTGGQRGLRCFKRLLCELKLLADLPLPPLPNPLVHWRLMRGGGALWSGKRRLAGPQLATRSDPFSPPPAVGCPSAFGKALPEAIEDAGGALVGREQHADPHQWPMSIGALGEGRGGERQATRMLLKNLLRY